MIFLIKIEIKVSNLIYSRVILIGLWGADAIIAGVDVRIVLGNVKLVAV